MQNLHEPDMLYLYIKTYYIYNNIKNIIQNNMLLQLLSMAWCGVFKHFGLMEIELSGVYVILASRVNTSSNVVSYTTHASMMM